MKLKFVFYIFILFAFGESNGAQTPSKFDFGAGKIANGFTQIQAENFYNAAKGYGFEPSANVVCSDSQEKDVLRSDFCASEQPFYFSVKVPEGNYKVTVTFGNKTQKTNTTVKAELRRLMLENIETKTGKYAVESFVVNVRNPQFPGGEVKLKEREKTMEAWAWDDKLTLEFNGSRPTINALTIEKVEVPTVFLLGDSTVCDQPGEPYASWGQMITNFFKIDVAVANHAESGESLRSSLGAKRLDKVTSLIKAGDFLLIQYGHNDEKEKGENVGAFTTYKANLKRFVAEARKKGGIPILITPPHRRTFDESGKIINSHGDYPEAVRQTSREENVALIDLTELTKDFYEALGAEKSGTAFKQGDGTHHNNYGAYQIAKMIADSVKKQKLPLAKFLKKDFSGYDPKKPDATEKFSLPASPILNAAKPLGS